MDSDIVQLMVLAGIVVFLILRLKSVLGSREGFEKPPLVSTPKPDTASRHSFEVIDGGPDRDITDHVAQDSDAAAALTSMKSVQADFSVTEFLQGARGAYEMILMAFENGEISDLRPFLSADVYDSFDDVIGQRAAQGLTIDANFIGIREMSLVDATYDDVSQEAEISVRYVADLTSEVRDSTGTVIEGSATEIKRQKDVWTFARGMGSDDPNWQLVATGE